MKNRPLLKGFGVAVLILAIAYGLVVAGFFALSKGELQPLIGGGSVGVVTVSGVIDSSSYVIEQLHEFRKDSSVQAIVLRINSPGGAVGPAQEIYEEVTKINAEKKVVASLGNTAASGGYYIACGAEKIVANPGTLTGSIGVIMEFINARGLYEMIGLQTSSVKSGEFKDMGASDRPMTARERKLLQEVIDNVYLQFVDAVAKGRKLDKDTVMTIADGRIMTGEQARDAGLVDELGNLEDSIELAGKLAGIKGSPNVVYSKSKHSSLLDTVFDYLGESLSRVVQRAASPMFPAGESVRLSLTAR
jgi:protease IV